MAGMAIRFGKTMSRNFSGANRWVMTSVPEIDTGVYHSPRGVHVEVLARAHVKQASISVCPDNVTIFDQIVAGKADLMIIDAIETRLQQKLKPALCALHPEAPFDFSEKAYLLPRDYLWKTFVDRWLHQTIASGAFAPLLEKWLSHPRP